MKHKSRSVTQRVSSDAFWNQKNLQKQFLSAESVATPAVRMKYLTRPLGHAAVRRTYRKIEYPKDVLNVSHERWQ